MVEVEGKYYHEQKMIKGYIARKLSLYTETRPSGAVADQRMRNGFQCHGSIVDKDRSCC